MSVPDSSLPPAGAAERAASGSFSLRGVVAALVDAIRGTQHDFTSGSITRAITLLAIPMVLEMSMESLFAIFDCFFVSHLGDAAIATVGITESMMTIIYALAIGLCMGTTALVARRIGEKNSEGASRVARQAIILGIALGVGTGAVCACFAAELLALMKADAQVIAIGSGYTAVLLGTNVVIFLLHLQNAIFRGAGDAALAMRSLWLANAVNLVLDPCLIFGLGPFPELGLLGAGIGSTIGRGVGVVYQISALRRGRSRIHLPRPLFRVEPAILRELLRLSVGGVTQFIIATASWVVLMRLVSPFGSAAVAGYTIAVRVVIFTILPAWGMSNAAATLVGQNLGARKPERAERSVWLTGWYNMAFFCLVMVIFLAFGSRMIRWFSDNPETVRHGADALRIMSYGYIFYAWGMVITMAFNGAGDTMTPTRINFVCFWLVQIPLAWTLATRVELGPPGVYWSVAIAESILAVAAIAVFRTGRWKTTQVAPDVPAAVAAEAEA